MDNASVCDVFIRAAGIMLLKKYSLQFHLQNAWICCLAHLVNLVVQCLLASLNETDDPEMGHGLKSYLSDLGGSIPMSW